MYVNGVFFAYISDIWSEIKELGPGVRFRLNFRATSSYKSYPSVQWLLSSIQFVSRAAIWHGTATDGIPQATKMAAKHAATALHSE